jgi:hypothetical protein
MRFWSGNASFIVLANLTASVPALVVVLARVDTGVLAHRVLARVDTMVLAYIVVAKSVTAEVIMWFGKLPITKLGHECSLRRSIHLKGKRLQYRVISSN